MCLCKKGMIFVSFDSFSTLMEEKGFFQIVKRCKEGVKGVKNRRTLAIFILLEGNYPPLSISKKKGNDVKQARICLIWRKCRLVPVSLNRD